MQHLPSFFKSKPPKPFLYKPRYYNPDKEALKARIAAITSSQESDTRSDALRHTLQEKWKRKSGYSNQRKASNQRIMLIAGILIIIAYIILS